MRRDRDRSLLIIGLGLIGGSVAAAARAAGYRHIVGFDLDAAAGEYARGQNLIDALAVDVGAAAAAAELTVIAVPVAAVADWVAEVATAAPGTDLVVTDAGSVKGSVIDACRARLGALPAWFVPGHPLAGSERSGAGAARADLFRDRRVILTPEAGTDARALDVVETFWQRLGATVTRMPAPRHDRIVARTSHLPHLAAFALMDTFADEPALLQFGAGGLRDTTRIAGADAGLWRGIFAANARELVLALDDLQARLAAVRSALEHGDLDAVEALCGRAQSLRHGWMPADAAQPGALQPANSAAPVIAIDGPSGAGKGTVATLLARRLGWHLLDSGAVYRALALVALRDGIALTDGNALAARAARLDLRFEERPDGIGVFVDGQDATNAIRGEDVSAATSKLAVLPQVRLALRATQRQARQTPGLVADGRDMATVVFADAGLKVFLTASAEERAQRRYKQLIQKGLPANLPALVAAIRERDERDAGRSESPLRPAEGALVIDCTAMSPDEVVAAVLVALQASGVSPVS